MSCHRLAFALMLAAPIVASCPVQMLEAQQPDASTRFRRDPAITRSIQTKILEAVRAEDPQGATQLEQAFRGDVVAAVAPAFRPFNYSTDDVVDMTAVYWLTAWEASNHWTGERGDPAIARGVRAQLAKVMTPELRGKSDAQKQEVADTMLIQALIVDARMRAVQTQASDQMQQMSDMIHREASDLLKTDLRAVEATAQGFKPKTGEAP